MEAKNTMNNQVDEKKLGSGKSHCNIVWTNMIR